MNGCVCMGGSSFFDIRYCAIDRYVLPLRRGISRGIFVASQRCTTTRVKLKQVSRRQLLKSIRKKKRIWFTGILVERQSFLYSVSRKYGVVRGTAAKFFRTRRDSSRFDVFMSRHIGSRCRKKIVRIFILSYVTYNNRYIIIKLIFYLMLLTIIFFCSWEN